MDYQATYRRTSFAIPALLALVAFILVGSFVGVRSADGETALTIIVGVLGIAVVLALAILLSAFRVHRWTIAGDGVHVHERPKIPLAGLSRRAFVAFADIAALRRVESGFDRLIELVARDGRCYRMPEAKLPNRTGLQTADPAADLGAFAESIRAAAARVGHSPRPISEGLSFWNKPAGIACLLLLFVVSLLFAGAVGWTMLGGGLSLQPRGGVAAVVALLLPVGAGYVLLQAIRRRNLVLSLAAP